MTNLNERVLLLRSCLPRSYIVLRRMRQQRWERRKDYQAQEHKDASPLSIRWRRGRNASDDA